jgi:glycosyltransferase involved in cell wall biosynthesis
VSRELPSFDLVVATVGRTAELARFLDLLAAQGYPRTRVLLVDQNDDDRVAPIVSSAAVDVVRLRSRPGLSRARNVALPHLEAAVVAFPDDDCVYPLGLLRQLGERFADRPELDGVTGRAEGFDGSVSPSWRIDPARLDRENLWNRAISFTIFLRRSVVESVGAFDEGLGLGSATPWHSAEEIDYLVRAIDGGAVVEYDPALVVRHDVREDTPAIGLRDGASVGYLLRKHRYPGRVVGRMLVRPAGGLARSLARRDWRAARYQLATLGGRVRGYFGATRSKISA